MTQFSKGHYETIADAINEVLRTLESVADPRGVRGDEPVAYMTAGVAMLTAALQKRFEESDAFDADLFNDACTKGMAE